MHIHTVHVTPLSSWTGPWAVRTGAPTRSSLQLPEPESAPAAGDVQGTAPARTVSARRPRASHRTVCPVHLQLRPLTHVSLPSDTLRDVTLVAGGQRSLQRLHWACGLRVPTPVELARAQGGTGEGKGRVLSVPGGLTEASGPPERPQCVLRDPSPPRGERQRGQACALCAARAARCAVLEVAVLGSVWSAMSRL